MPHDPPGLSRAISDRHFGVGGDGLILICPSDKADARMRMFNADGSEAEMCGNGVRCVAKFVYDHGLVRKSPLTIETGRGVLTLELEVSGGGECGRCAWTWASRSCKPSAFRPRLPAIRRWRPPWKSAGQTLRVTCVSMGNPHCITFVDAITDAQVLGLGPQIERHPAFPRRVNVEFVRVNRPDDVTMRVWERGSGETLACGTGACAVAVAGVSPDARNGASPPICPAATCNWTGPKRIITCT